MRTFIFFLALLLSAFGASARSGDAVYSRTVPGDFQRIYRDVYTGLEKAGFHVVYEAFISNALAKHAKEWGDDYNRNHYDVVRSIVICSPYYANQILNHDPKMMVVCPIKVTVLYKQGRATVLYEKLESIDEHSPARKVLQKVDDKIMGVIRSVPAG